MEGEGEGEAATPTPAGTRAYVYGLVVFAAIATWNIDTVWLHAWPGGPVLLHAGNPVTGVNQAFAPATLRTAQVVTRVAMVVPTGTKRRSAPRPVTVYDLVVAGNVLVSGARDRGPLDGAAGRMKGWAYHPDHHLDVHFEVGWWPIWPFVILAELVRVLLAVRRAQG